MTIDDARRLGSVETSASKPQARPAPAAGPL